MVQVLLEVHIGMTHFTVAIRAESLLRAVAITRDSYPGSDVRVIFPIDPDAFFVRDVGTPGQQRLARRHQCRGYLAVRQEAEGRVSLADTL